MGEKQKELKEEKESLQNEESQLINQKVEKLTLEDNELQDSEDIPLNKQSKNNLSETDYYEIRSRLAFESNFLNQLDADL